MRNDGRVNVSLPSTLLRLGAAACAIVAGLSITALAATTASATVRAVDCTAVVSDAAGILDADRVLDAATSVDARVLVLTFDAVPGGDFDAAVASVRRQCPEWQDGPADWAADMVVLAVAPVERDSGVYYGSGLDETLGGGQWELAVDAMNARFGNGDWTGGMVAGLEEVRELGGTDDTGTPTDSSDPGESGAGSSSDVDWGWGLGIVGGLAAAGGLGYGGVRLRRRIATRAAARVAASAACDGAAAAFLRLEEVAEFTGARAADLPQVTDAGITAARAQADQARAAGEAATATYLAHSEAHSAESVAKADYDEAVAATESGNAAGAVLATAIGAWEKAEEMITALHTSAETTPGVLDGAEKTVGETRAEFAALEADGYRTASYAAVCDEHTTRIGEARAMQAASRWGDAATAAAALAADTTAGRAAVTGLRQRRDAILQETTALNATHGGLVAALADAHAVVAELDATRHSECVTDVRDGLVAGEQTHTQAARTLAEAARTATMEVQDFDAAEQQNAQARSELTAVAEAAAAPARRRDELVTLAAQLPVRVTAAGEALQRLNASLVEQAAAVEFLDTSPDVSFLGTRVGQLNGELAADRPALITLDAEVATLSAGIAEAQAQVDDIAAQYLLVMSKLDQAAAEIRDAESWAGRPHAGSRATELVQEAQASLQAAHALPTLAQASSDAEAAIRTAREAQSAARSAIDAHEAEQRRQQEAARRAAAASRSTSSFGGGRSGGGSRGGARSFSSGSRGGSRSFGGGSRGGSKKF